MPPLVFEPHYWNRVWGGRSLSTQFGRRIPDGLVGESWEVSTHPNHLSRVAEGRLAGRLLVDLWNENREELAGARAAKVDRFPLLVKLLDCQQRLSVQVHPNSACAARLCPHETGKSEAWVVLAAPPGARLLAGMKRGVTQADILRALHDGTIADCLEELRPSVGDCIAIPPGVPHALLGPLVLLEVQPTSDATFRLFDWNRVDLNGQPRKLHIDESLAAMDWNCGPISAATPSPLALQGTNNSSIESTRLLTSPDFRIDRHVGAGQLSVPYLDEMSVWLIVSGRATLCDASGYARSFVAGETVLVPATHDRCQWLLAERCELIAALPPQ